MLRLTPVTFKAANDFVEERHRHHGRVPPGFHNFTFGVIDDAGALRGVAIVGRPANRNNDNGETLEVLRVATDGARNACSMLVGAAARAARAIGARRIITYTLDHESGASLRAAGWRLEKEGIKSFWLTPSSGRSTAVARPHMQATKRRWALDFQD